MKETEEVGELPPTKDVLLEEGKAEIILEQEVLCPAAVVEEKEPPHQSPTVCSQITGDEIGEEHDKEESRPITLGPAHELHYEGHTLSPLEEKVVWMESFYPRSPFTNGICDCCASGWRNACLVFICQPCARASARTRMNGTNWYFNLCCGCSPYSSSGMRSIIREGYNIEGSCMSDIVAGTLCSSCSDCQILSEVDGRGKGEAHWHAKRNDEPQPWDLGLCDFNPDCNVFLCGLCCCCCAFAYSRFLFDTSDCLFNLFCVSCCMIHSIIAEGYNMESRTLDHVLLPCFCPCCTACQLVSEVKKRGRINTTFVAVPQSELMIRS